MINVTGGAGAEDLQWSVEGYSCVLIGLGTRRSAKGKAFADRAAFGAVGWPWIKILK